MRLRRLRELCFARDTLAVCSPRASAYRAFNALIVPPDQVELMSLRNTFASAYEWS